MSDSKPSFRSTQHCLAFQNLEGHQLPLPCPRAQEIGAVGHQEVLYVECSTTAKRINGATKLVGPCVIEAHVRVLPGAYAPHSEQS